MDEIDAILGGLPPKAEAPEPELSVSDVGLDAAVDDVFAAIEAKDKGAFKSALRGAVEMLLAARDVEGEDFD